MLSCMIARNESGRRSGLSIIKADLWNGMLSRKLDENGPFAAS